MQIHGKTGENNARINRSNRQVFWCHSTNDKKLEEGHFDVVYTHGEHRRYNTEKIEEMKNEGRRKTIIYASVSGHDRKEDLHRQIEELKDYCKEQEIKDDEVIKNVGSGINYRKSGQAAAHNIRKKSKMRWESKEKVI